MAEMKPHLALTVSDVERAVPFYRGPVRTPSRRR